VEYWSTLRLADVDGDGRADLCARTTLDFRCHLSQGDGFGGPVLGPALADADGWNARGRFATLRLADIDGDGRRDVCARDAGGMACWLWTGAGFDRRVSGPPLSDADGWTASGRYRTLRFADVDGDGRDDLCARAADGLRCWLAGVAGFTTVLRGPAWTDAAGWAAPGYGDTIRLGGPPAGRAPAAADDGAAGCGCATAAVDRDGGATWLLLAVLPALARRRRKCARVPGRHGRRHAW
jgi:MYXO-CTERM domain-containing protein